MNDELKIDVHKVNGWYIFVEDDTIMQIDGWYKTPGKDYMSVHVVDAPENDYKGWINDYENEDEEAYVYISREEAEQARKEIDDRRTAELEAEEQKIADALKELPMYRRHDVIHKAMPGHELRDKWQKQDDDANSRALDIIKRGGLSFTNEKIRTFIPLNSIDHYEFDPKSKQLSITTKSGNVYSYEDDACLNEALEIVWMVMRK